MYLLILFLPLMSFFICLILGRYIGMIGSKIISNIILLTSFIISILFFIEWNSGINMNLNITSWFNIGLLYVPISIHIDHITSCMLILITMVSFLVHLFSTSYMEGDPHIIRFMSYLSLFTFFMIILVTSNNIVQMFIGWEGVGLTSYLLINFWYTRIQANKAAIKAMVVNKVGDIGLLLGIVSLWSISGLLRFHDFMGLSIFPNLEYFFNWINVMLIIGVMAKSAQIGLHTWLPDAMEGPTPVSALIHAATMVTAGVFLLIRISPILEFTPLILLFVIFLGALTAFMSGTIGLVQSDLKKVIAYSTCSQLGYMVMICGFSHYHCGLFHLFNHGFFKALLFLSAGSIIHAVNNEQDMRKIGGVKFTLPLSYICVIIGSLSLTGLPFLTGFYSKDLLLELIYQNHYLSFALWLGLLTTFLTAFYSFRLVSYTFLANPSMPTKTSKILHEGEWNLFLPLLFLLIFSITIGFFMTGFIMIDISPPILPTINKFHPLILTILGSLFAIYFTYYLIYLWKTIYINIIIYIYDLFSKAWYWDPISSKYLISNILNSGFVFTYKLLDNQFIEMLGPYGGSKVIINNSSKLSHYHIGKIASYSLSLIIFIYILSISSFDFGELKMLKLFIHVSESVQVSKH
uniref:NADH dehydrogenase subunit 5 n=1 Tax=Halistemma rubrum TaxID=316183 RepID=UPI0026E17E02|nr:NADH dehydrogenase subunit 5 [Halistemma rubrum]WJJ70213.1 NADH dehydrogenase subunit 5 [Halistemma rubrum]